MKKLYLTQILILTVIIVPYTYCQTIIDAELRPRAEFRQGFRKPLSDTLTPAFVTLQRTRLNASYNGKTINAKISLQDARIWGDNKLKTNTSNIEIYEAWFEYKIIPSLSVQMGRQPLKYDDQRIFAAPNWSNTGMAHDIMVIKYSSPVITIHSGFAYNNSKDTLLNVDYSYTPKQNYRTMGYLWLSKEIYKGFSMSAIGVMEGHESPTNYQVVYPRITYGANLFYKNDSSIWEGILTAYFQDGKDPNKTYNDGYADLSSYFLAAKITCKPYAKLTLSLGFDYYSGSKTTVDQGKSNTFNRLYGSNHSFNGSMEYFTSLPKQGLIDYYASVSYKLASKLLFELAGHSFYFDKSFISNNQTYNKNIGSEADFALKYTASKELTIQSGVSMFFNSSSTLTYFKMPGADIHQPLWGYLMITVKPQLFKSSPESEKK